MTSYMAFESLYHDVAMFVAYIVSFALKLVFNFIFSCFVTLYFASSHFSVTYQFYNVILDLFLYFKYLISVLGMHNRIICEHFQESAVLHLTKCWDSILYSMLLFLQLLIVFKDFSNNTDLILGTFFSLWLNSFFLETRLVIKNGLDIWVSLYTFFFISLEISFAFKFLLIPCGDVEVNPGPGHWTSLSFCHWNLTSISTHDFVKVSLLEACHAIHKFDIICLSKTFLNSSLQNDDSLVLNGYKLVRANNTK